MSDPNPELFAGSGSAIRILDPGPGPKRIRVRFCLKPSFHQIKMIVFVDNGMKCQVVPGKHLITIKFSEKK